MALSQRRLIGRLNSVDQPLKRKFYRSNTCYDGEQEFNYVQGKRLARYYPDEDVIVSILNAYLKKTKHSRKSQIQIATETMHWDDSGRLVKSLDVKAIITQAKQAYARNKKPRLLLIPFHYHYHHSFLACDFAHDKYLFCDPKGHDLAALVGQGKNEYVPLASFINEMNESKEDQGRASCITTKQQLTGDGVSCGPIVTQCLIEVTDAFFAAGKTDFLSAIQFESPRKKLNSMKLALMNLQNTHVGEEDDLIKEEMLASPELWQQFFAEQGLSAREITILLNYLHKNKFFTAEVSPALAKARLQLQQELVSNYPRLLAKLELKELITKLKTERDSSCFFASRKQKKIEALQSILDKLEKNASSTSIRDAIFELQKQHIVQAGLFSHRTRDLLESIYQRLNSTLSVENIPAVLIPEIDSCLSAKDRCALSSVSRFFDKALNAVDWKKKIIEELTAKPVKNKLNKYRLQYLRGKVLKQNIQKAIKNFNALEQPTDEQKAQHKNNMFIYFIHVVDQGYEKLCPLFDAYKFNVNQYIRGHTDTNNKLIHLAALTGNEVILKKLIEAGANVNDSDAGVVSSLEVAVWVADCGSAALAKAAYKGNLACMRLLLDHGALVNGSDASGYTALHHVARYDYVDCVKLLLERGARVDLRTNLINESAEDQAPEGSESKRLIQARRAELGLPARRGCCDEIRRFLGFA